MPRALIRLLSIVAAILWSSTAPAEATVEAPVPPTIVEAARMLGMDVSRVRGLFLANFVRLLYTLPETRTPALALVRQPIGQRSQDSQPRLNLTVPVPLTAEVWSDAIFGRTVSVDDLVSAIAADRRAALMARALTALDDETLEYLVDHPSVLGQLYQHGAAAFGAFGVALRIADGRVVTPGGDEAVPLWESVVGYTVDEPPAFVEALYMPHGGHLAYLYDAVHWLDEPHARFVTSSWMTDSSVRTARFSELASVIERGYDDWDMQALPFSRPLNDFVFAVLRVRVDESGRPLPPAERGFWSRALGVGHTVADDESSFDAAWLAQITTSGDLYWRGDRIDQVGFGQRVFGSVPREGWSDAIAAVAAFPRYRALMLTMERMGIRTPAVYAAAVHRGDALARLRSERTFWALAQFQGALALLSRMTLVGTLTTETAERLVSSLLAVDVSGDGRYGRQLAVWLETSLIPVLPIGDDVEGQLNAALAGPSPGDAAQRIDWEGQHYVVDLPAAERIRLRAVRDRQGGATVDLALGMNRIAGPLLSPSAESVRSASRELDALADQFGSELSRSGSDVAPPQVPVFRQVYEQVVRLRTDLSRAAANDSRRTRSLGSSLMDLSESLLGEALLSWAYALDIGDPGGTALVARNIALRHDFGLDRSPDDARLRRTWGVPYQDFLPGVPWHVAGSVLGLDVALASMSLRRTDLDRTLQIPRLPSNERETFQVGVSLLNPNRLRDVDRDAIARAVARGQARLTTALGGAGSLGTIAQEVRMDGWRQRALGWMLEHDRQAIPSMFALGELILLGGGDTEIDLDAWGLAAHNLYGCLCTRFVPPSLWPLLVGRPRIGLMGSLVSDLNLQVAVGLARLRVPAVLAREVLAGAVIGFTESVEPTDPNDWWTVAQTAQQIPLERIEDYVAGAALVDGPLVPYNPGSDSIP